MNVCILTISSISHNCVCKVALCTFSTMNILAFSLFDQPKVCLDVNLWRSTGAQNNERCAVCWLMTPDGLTNSVREYVRLYMYYMWTLCKDVELLHSVISFLITREAGLDTPSNKAFCILWWFPHDLNAWTLSLQHKRPRFVEQQLSTAFGWLKLETSSHAAKGSPWAGSPNIHIDNRTMSKVWSCLKIKLNSSTSEVPKSNQSEANLLGLEGDNGSCGATLQCVDECWWFSPEIACRSFVILTLALKHLETTGVTASPSTNCS